MRNLFNKTFFGFLFGFVGIIALSFAVITAVGYYDASRVSIEEAAPASFER